ncbi:hypothetical protein BKK79_06680 [Cupriavidus sp. USMAA2-4]|nr:hypothetical protein BKK79_06680 [Cupriavidus sp. USMAA2-4]
MTALYFDLLLVIHDENEICLAGQHVVKLLGTVRVNVYPGRIHQFDGRRVGGMPHQRSEAG